MGIIAPPDSLVSITRVDWPPNRDMIFREIITVTIVAIVRHASWVISRKFRITIRA